MPDQAYEASPKRPGEEQTAYVMRILREEIRHGALTEAAASLRAVAAERRRWAPTTGRTLWHWRSGRGSSPRRDRHQT